VKITPFIIEQFASWLAGGTPFAAMRTIVADYNDSSLTGAEKRAAVLGEFEKIGYSLAGWLANLLLELAVAWLKSKSGEQ
jgi:hypothetical protein